MITIKDIAKEANVSAGTVDRVLHNRGGVSTETEQKIKKILKERNFKINLIASSLAMKKNHTLATLIPNFDQQNIFWKSPHLGIEKGSQEVKAYGIENHIFTFNQFDPNSYAKAFRELIKTSPDAVILVPIFLKETKAILEKLKDKKIPYLFLNINLKGSDSLCYIGQKSFEAGILAGKLSNICTTEDDEILMVLTRKNLFNHEAIQDRIEGFLDFHQKSNSKTKIHKLQFNQPDEVFRSREKINQFIEKHPKVKGVVVPSSRVSVVCKAIDKEKLVDLRIIGFDTTPQNIDFLKRGDVTFLISQKSFNQGYKSIITIANFLVHREIPSNEIPTPLEIITKENYMFSHSEERKYSIE